MSSWRQQQVESVWAANATSNTTYFPTIQTSSGSSIYPYAPLQGVAEPSAEYAADRDARLTAIEWLERQVDDVCRLARAA